MDTELVPNLPPGNELDPGPILSPAERYLLWAAICEAAKQLDGRPTICLRGSTTSIQPSASVPNVKDWQMAEALALLCVLLRAGSVHAHSLILFAKLPHLTIGERGRKLNLWFQPETLGHISNLRAKPDIAVTVRPDCGATGGNLQRVIEVKRVKKLGAATVRQEFAKAFDLNVRTYCLLTYYEVRPDICGGAKKLGLDVVELFDARGRTPAELVSHVCAKLEQSRNEERFAANIKKGYEDYLLKQLTFNP